MGSEQEGRATRAASRSAAAAAAAASWADGGTIMGHPQREGGDRRGDHGDPGPSSSPRSQQPSSSSSSSVAEAFPSPGVAGRTRTGMAAEADRSDLAAPSPPPPSTPSRSRTGLPLHPPPHSSPPATPTSRLAHTRPPMRTTLEPDLPRQRVRHNSLPTAAYTSSRRARLASAQDERPPPSSPRAGGTSLLRSVIDPPSKSNVSTLFGSPSTSLAAAPGIGKAETEGKENAAPSTHSPRHPNHLSSGHRGGIFVSETRGFLTASSKASTGSAEYAYVLDSPHASHRAGAAEQLGSGGSPTTFQHLDLDLAAPRYPSHRAQPLVPMSSPHASLLLGAAEDREEEEEEEEEDQEGLGYPGQGRTRTAASSSSPSLPRGGGGGSGRKRTASLQLAPDRASKKLDGRSAAPPPKRKPAPKFSAHEDQVLLRGVEALGEHAWEELLGWGNFDPSIRTPASLRTRWARLSAKSKPGGGGDSTPAAAPSDPAPKPGRPASAAALMMGVGTSYSNLSALSLEEGGRVSAFLPSASTPKSGRRVGGSGRSVAGCYEDGDGGDREDEDEEGGGLDPDDFGLRSSPAPVPASLAMGPASTAPSGLRGAAFGSSPGQPAKASHRRIDDYFPRFPSTKAMPSASNSQFLPSSPLLGTGAGGAAGASGLGTLTSSSAAAHAIKFKSPLRKMERLKKALREHEAEIALLHQERAELQRQNDQLTARVQQAESEVEHLERIHVTFKQEMCMKVRLMESRREEREEKARATLLRTLREQALQTMRQDRLIANERSLSIAAIVYERHGVNFSERWQEGYKLTDLQRQLSILAREREELEKRRKSLAKKFKEDKKGEDDPSIVQDYQEADEISKLRLLALKKEETELLAALDALNVERDAHIRECRRIREEDASRFNNHPVLHDRYLLLKLIGKGGFSEVYKAFDLVEMCYVACKIHSLSEHWSDEKKQSYIKHSVREYNIHKALDHPRIIRFLDVFEYDHFSFCTILEYCEGRDLESHLQATKCIPERDARSIISQVVSALKYMNELDTPIIHYDLKPGNILLHSGEVKITDFGLSKIIETLDVGGPRGPFGATKETDLTSQGAGTYWYLPPEVFEARPGEAVKISSKVDVWSLGVIFFEVLYGTKPFGNNKSQYSILKESIITNDAQYLTFPPKPTVSQETKDFIRRCLEYRKEKRPDILALARDPYFRPALARGKGGGASSAAASAPPAPPAATSNPSANGYASMQQLMSDY